jgi:phosphopantothenoylcysteine decarboxylase/phosphopantothenate--cysteine ligase
MYTHPATQANLALLQSRGAFIIEPEVGRLASGAVGPGRLPDITTLLGAIHMVLGRKGDLAGRRVIVTAGGTQEPLDPVRYLGNRSSGKMGYQLAVNARNRGAHVILVSGPVALPTPYGVELHRVETARQMQEAVFSFVNDADVLVMSAAVGDFRPVHVAMQKIKKDDAPACIHEESGERSIRLVSNPDILGELAATLHGPGVSNPHRRLIRVGFAAETEHIVDNAREKLQKKDLDLLVANDVSRPDSGFGSDTNKVLIFHASGVMEDLPLMPKTGVATAIWDRVVPLLGTE